MKGIIHFHSKFSYDCHISIDRIIDFAIDAGLEFLILTDHDAIAGSTALRKRVKERGENLLVPLAAEYLTEAGDVIAVFIDREIKAKNLDAFADEVRHQGGILLFPHPYQQHPKGRIDEIAEKVDLIEVYNQRCSFSDDQKARELASKYGKAMYPGSDAHLYSELRNVIIEINCKSEEQSMKAALLKEGAQPLITEKTKKRKVAFSQIIKAVKHRKLSILYHNLKGLVRAALFFKLNDSCG